jgi:hypothetical protein
MTSIQKRLTAEEREAVWSNRYDETCDSESDLHEANANTIGLFGAALFARFFRRFSKSNTAATTVLEMNGPGGFRG